MPSKGVKCYSYIAVPGAEIEFSVPKQSITKQSQHSFSCDHLEVESKNLKHFRFTGRFQFVVRRDGRELLTQWVDVNTMTGSLEDGTMQTMEQTPSFFTEDVVVSYGFYDAGPGFADLPKQHQCYVTVTQNHEDWMREVAPPGAEQENRPFHKMVLPSAHDIGMNSMETSHLLLEKAGTGIIKELLGRSLPHVFSIFNKVGDGAINRIAPDIIRALAITQKDTLETILKLGARYFEFRPAKCHRQMTSVCPHVEDTWYFQHGAIPGMLYKAFLHDIVTFLRAHPDEVIVVQNRWDGVPEQCPRPNDDELRAVLDDVLRDTDIAAGNQDDMEHRTIRELRRDRKRLVVTRDMAQVSNYDDAASATLDGASIVEKLHAMAADPPRGHPLTLLQCQATATNIRNVIIASVVEADVSTSPILATKGVCDGKILPLLRDDVGRRLAGDDGLCVLLNDFFDGATAEVAMGLCRERLG